MTAQDPLHYSPTTQPPAANGQDPLAQLQDIHLPDAVGIWPLAWGWWLIIIVILSGLTLLILLIKRKHQRNAYRALALMELNALANQFNTEQNAEYLQALSILLRRTALSGCGQYFDVSLKGLNWLAWLDKQCVATQNQFSQGVGTALLIGPYQKAPQFDRDALHQLAILWLKEHRNQWQQKAYQQSASESKMVDQSKKAEVKQHV